MPRCLQKSRIVLPLASCSEISLLQYLRLSSLTLSTCRLSNLGRKGGSPDAYPPVNADMNMTWISGRDCFSAVAKAGPDIPGI